jgi:catechol 2,3-dioxygenase-like lactoylglutathione lyase family enzyme
VTPIWYHVRNLDAGRAFYTQKLGFTETYVDESDRWAQLQRNETKIGIAQGEPQEEGSVAHVDVDDIKALADELRTEGVEIGVVFELHNEIRLLDVFDPDGNRLQFAQQL